MAKSEAEDGADKKKTDTDLEAADAGQARFLGSHSEAFQNELVRQVASSLSQRGGKTREEFAQLAYVALATLRDLGPRSELEAMLIAQMISTNDAAMDCLSRASIPEQSLQARDLHLKHAAKLMSLYERQLAALDKHRGKGKQKITVEHINVHSGGQAIVGNVQADGSKSATEPMPAAPPAEAPLELTEEVGGGGVGIDVLGYFASKKRERIMLENEGE